MSDLPAAPFCRHQIHALGVSQGTFRAWLGAGSIRRVFRSVYVASDVPDTLELRIACASLVLPRHTVIVERTAAWVHGINLHAPHERFVVPDLEVVSLRGHTSIRRPGIYGGSRDLQPQDIMEINGVTVTTPLRTALDLACLDGLLPAIAALDAFMRAFGITREEFERELPRFRRRRGVVQLRRAVPLATPLAESQAESWLRAALIQEGFELPEPQIEVREGGTVVRIDMGYRHLLIAIEYFGEEFHGPDAEEHDQARIEWLSERGWFVLVIRKEDLRGERWRQTCGVLRDAVTERSQPRGKRRYPRGQPWEG